MIENCPAAQCTVAGVSDCPQCAAGFYAVRRDTAPTECLPVSMTLKAAGLSASANGRFTVTLAGSDVPRDLTGGAFIVPSTVALELRGSPGAAAPQLGTTYIVGGTLRLFGVGGAINGLGVTPGGAFAIDEASSATIGGEAIPACSTVSSHDGTLTNDCPAAMMIEVWDSGGTLNKNGVTFTLFKLAPQPPNTFAYDAASAQRYADLCGAVGLRTVASGTSNCASYCAQYKCMPVAEWGASDFAQQVHTNTGWDDLLVTLGGGSNPQAYTASTALSDCPASSSSSSCHYTTYSQSSAGGWGLFGEQLSPICGVEHL
jgi:hypothetical protein